MTAPFTGRYGPLPLAAGYRFRLYAPAVERADVTVDGRITPMERRGDWFVADDPQAHATSRYAFIVDSDRRIPDPGSRFQPDGVHEPSAIVVSAFEWPDDGWRGRPMHEYIIYELHVGTFTFEGTYASASAKLPELVALGITAIELMPLSAFPGARNWGYDGVLPFAPFAGYGTPDDLKRFVAAAHKHKLAVVLDVVYNHFGPEGNYLHGIAPTFFNPETHTPWGAGIDVTVPDVAAYFAENAAYWLAEYRFDGLRLDATHAVIDPAPPNFFHAVRMTAIDAVSPDRIVTLVVENDDNDTLLLDDGYDGQWNDDVHHALHVIATGETNGYYRDYASDPIQWLGRALTSGYAYQGEASDHRGGKLRGSPSARFTFSHFVDFLQNHDQIGNRALGERIAQLASPAAMRAISTLLYLAPAPPLLFMGEEWAASTPFLFFCDFEPALATAVTDGRRREFESFPQFSDPHVRALIPDPNAPGTFEASRLRWEERGDPPHAAVLAHTTALLHARLRHIIPAIEHVRGTDATMERIGATGLLLRWTLPDGTLHADANLDDSALAGFPERSTGDTIFTTHGDVYAGGVAPAWAVRWSRT